MHRDAWNTAVHWCLLLSATKFGLWSEETMLNVPGRSSGYEHPRTLSCRRIHELNMHMRKCSNHLIQRHGEVEHPWQYIEPHPRVHICDRNVIAMPNLHDVWRKCSLLQRLRTAMVERGRADPSCREVYTRKRFDRAQMISHKKFSVHYNIDTRRRKTTEICKGMVYKMGRILRGARKFATREKIIKGWNIQI
jgi:hypothetical protein